MVPAIGRAMDSRFTEHGLPTGTRLISPQPVSPIWKLAQASYPHPLEGRRKKQELRSHGLQDENQSYRSEWGQDDEGGLRFHRMASKSHWGVNIWYASRKGRMTPEGNTEIIRASTRRTSPKTRSLAIAQQTM